METTKNIEYFVHHRSKQRIRDFGEVWTPAKYVHQLLDMLNKSIWTDTNTIFFEPTCGHGNFVSAIVKRRLNALLGKAKKQKIKKPHFYSVANTLNNLWAIDIEYRNIESCRGRVQSLVFDFLWEQEKNKSSLNEFITENKSFLAHALSCIEWQIHKNEVLSCLETDILKATEVSDKTAVSRKWFKRNGHHPIDFNKTWLWHFSACKKKNTIPIEYTKNFKIVSLLTKKREKIQKHKSTVEEFGFTNFSFKAKVA